MYVGCFCGNAESCGLDQVPDSRVALAKLRPHLPSNQYNINTAGERLTLITPEKTCNLHFTCRLDGSMGGHVPGGYFEPKIRQALGKKTYWCCVTLFPPSVLQGGESFHRVFTAREPSKHSKVLEQQQKSKAMLSFPLSAPTSHDHKRTLFILV